jgi:hypothetical protein
MLHLWLMILLQTLRCKALLHVMYRCCDKATDRLWQTYFLSPQRVKTYFRHNQIRRRRIRRQAVTYWVRCDMILSILFAIPPDLLTNHFRRIPVSPCLKYSEDACHNSAILDRLRASVDNEMCRQLILASFMPLTFHCGILLVDSLINMAVCITQEVARINEGFRRICTWDSREILIHGRALKSSHPGA